MKILVCGGSGFIGSTFIQNYLKSHPEFNITNIDNLSIGSNQDNLKEIKNNSNYHFIQNNITNESVISNFVKDSDIVVNFAAESHVDRSISDPKPFVETNIFGTYSLLEAIRKYNFKKKKIKLIHISTDEVYGDVLKGRSKEEDPYEPSSPYAASKASSDHLVSSYIRTFDLPAIVTNCSNNYGPRQHPEKLIPKIIYNILNNKPLPVYGNGKNIRDWIHVEDHCNAIIDVLHNGKSGESYNISANNEIDNLTIVRKILSIMDRSEDLIEFVEDRPGHDFRYSMSSKKIANELKWKITTNFEKGLEKTIEWYLGNPEILNNISQTVLNPTPWKNNQ